MTPERRAEIEARLLDRLVRGEWNNAEIESDNIIRELLAEIDRLNDQPTIPTNEGYPLELALRARRAADMLTRAAQQSDPQLPDPRPEETAGTPSTSCTEKHDQSAD